MENDRTESKKKSIIRYKLMVVSVLPNPIIKWYSVKSICIGLTRFLYICNF